MGTDPTRQYTVMNRTTKEKYVSACLIMGIRENITYTAEKHDLGYVVRSIKGGNGYSYQFIVVNKLHQFMQGNVCSYIV